MSNDTPCCSGENGCCAPKKDKKQIAIDFLYLDLSVCTRCQGTDGNLEEAINDVSAVLKSAGYEILIRKFNITNEELAMKHQFISSPTIRINGRDIAMEVKESPCKDCGDLCGEDSVNCRVWTFEDADFNVPPKAYIINEILKEVYAGHSGDDNKKEYELPQNLKNYFNALRKKRVTGN
jgi:hypothetical protein